MVVGSQLSLSILLLAPLIVVPSGRREPFTSLQDEFVSGDLQGRPPPHPQQIRHSHDITVFVLDSALRIVARHELARFVGKLTPLHALLLDMDQDRIHEIVTLNEFESPRILKLVD